MTEEPDLTKIPALLFLLSLCYLLCQGFQRSVRANMESGLISVAADSADSFLRHFTRFDSSEPGPVQRYSP